MLSDTELALPSLEESRLKLAKETENPSLVTQNPGGGYSGKLGPFFLNYPLKLAKSRGCIEKLRAGLVTLKVSVHDKSPTDTFGKVRASHLRQVLGNAAI